MFLEGLDALDRKIVRLLIKNARISYSDIGQEVGISRVAVKARIQALEQRGIIEEYTTIINPQKISGAGKTAGTANRLKNPVILKTGHIPPPIHIKFSWIL